MASRSRATGSTGSTTARVIFWEEMLALNYMLSKPDAWLPIQSLDAAALTGYYPARRCIRYTPAKDEYTVSMKDFVLRQASPPGPVGKQ